jgi:hypothetical protein
MISKLLFKVIKSKLDSYFTEIINKRIFNLSTNKQYLLILPERVSDRDLKEFSNLAGKINMIVITSDQFRLIEFDINSKQE